jgi:hypothetical protein
MPATFKPGQLTGDYRTDIASGGLPVVAPSGDLLAPNLRYKFLPQGWDDGWQAAVAGLASTPATVALVGASYEMGGSLVTDIYKTAWWPLFAKGLLAKYATSRYGDFFSLSYSSQWTSNAAPGGHPVIFDLAPATTSGVGPLFQSSWTVLNNSGSPLMHYQHANVSGAAYFNYQNLSGDIVYFDAANAAGGNWTWNLNGGATQTVTLTNSGTMKRVSWTSATPGWVNGNNVVNLMTQSASSIMVIVGFGAYPGPSGPGSSGIGIAWLAQSGCALNDLGRSDLSPAAYAGFMNGAAANSPGQIDKIAFFGGATNTGAAAPPYNQSFGFPFNAKLLCVGWFDDALYYQRLTDPGGTAAGGPNNSFGGNTYNQFGADPQLFRNMLSRLRRANMANQGSMLYTLGSVPSGVFSDVTMTGLVAQNFDAWAEQYYNVARMYNCGIVDHNQAWAERGFTLGYQGATNPHPTDAGHGVRANDILAVA